MKLICILFGLILQIDNFFFVIIFIDLFLLFVRQSLVS